MENPPIEPAIHIIARMGNCPTRYTVNSFTHSHTLSHTHAGRPSRAPRGGAGGHAAAAAAAAVHWAPDHRACQLAHFLQRVDPAEDVGHKRLSQTVLWSAGPELVSLNIQPQPQQQQKWQHTWKAGLLSALRAAPGSIFCGAITTHRHSRARHRQRVASAGAEICGQFAKTSSILPALRA